MKNVIIVIAITLCFSLILGVSVPKVLEYFNNNIAVMANIVAEVVSLGGFPQATGGYSIPLDIAQLGAIADLDIGLVDIRQYIINNFVPQWYNQSGDYNGTYTFTIECRVYPNFYYGNVETTGAGLTYRKENIYTGRMIRLDYTIKTKPLVAVSNVFTEYKYSVYVFPVGNSIRYLSFYYYNDEGLYASGYNTLYEFYIYDVYDIHDPIKNGDRARLVGYNYIEPQKGGTAYKIDGLLYTNVRLDSEANLFKQFIVGG